MEEIRIKHFESSDVVSRCIPTPDLQEMSVSRSVQNSVIGQRGDAARKCC